MPQLQYTDEYMEKKVFKTAQDAREYADTHYKGCEIEDASLSINCVDEAGNEIEGCKGEIFAFEVLDEDYDTLAVLGYWEEGDIPYHVKVDGIIKASFNNAWDARDAARKFADKADGKVTVTRNGEEIDF